MAHRGTRRPLLGAWGWQFHGACRGMELEAFFAAENERGERHTQRENIAKKICAECPVLSPCREYALEAREPYGVWGGLTERARLDMRGANEGQQEAV
jgi:WhiB family redox-sensing transcriptional regulator